MGSLLFWGLLLGSPAAGAAEAADPIAQVRAAQLDPAGARRIENLEIDTGGGRLRLLDGTLFPTTPVEGQVREFAFLGRARFEYRAPDAIEADQLELFTGGTSLSESITEAVLVVNRAAAAAELLRAPAAGAPAAALLARAGELLAEWRRSGERETLQVEQLLLADLLGDEAAEGSFVGWLHGEELGRFLAIYDPSEFEQITIGQFVPVEVGRRQARSLRRYLRKQQRKGRFIGLDVEELGDWDSWVSASPLDAEGRPVRGGLAFEARHVELEVSIAPGTLEISGRARLELAPRTGRHRALPLTLSRDLAVERVLDAAGNPLFFHQNDDRVLVAFDRPPAAGTVTSITCEYRGSLLDKAARARVLRSTSGWYPRLDSDDLSTYDVTFRWPAPLKVLASGRRSEGGQEGSQLWERRRLDTPARFFSFEIGEFELHPSRVGDIEILLALDPDTVPWVGGEVDELLRVARDTLDYFGEIFGPYPYGSLTLVTVPRSVSQASPGFVTLSRRAAYEAVGAAEVENNWIVAHEIAHQWFGHLIGWQSYRDQWISEGMANYAALLYVRNRRAGRRRGPTLGWRRALLDTTEDGRPIESLGPLVLGRRLFSSRSDEAYFAIVYRKGAVVIDMLSRSFGEENFLRILRSLLRAAAGRALSTEEFFALIEEISGASMAAFTRQFIYGTGLPEVYYDLQAERTEGGRWRIHGEARQRPPYRYEYFVERNAAGRLDVARRRIDQIDVADSTLAVPLQLALYDPDKKSRVEDPERRGNTVRIYDLLLRGPSTRIELEVDHEPKQIWMDRRSEVFGLFFNSRLEPKAVLYRQALDLLAQERWPEAEELLGRALEAERWVDPVAGPDDDPASRDVDRLHLDSEIQFALMRLHLDQGHTRSAAEALREGERYLRAAEKKLGPVRGVLRLREPSGSSALKARLELQKRNPRGAYDLLHDKVLKPRGRADRETLLAFALAAHQLGREREYRKAAERAAGRGIDLSLLESDEASELQGRVR